MKSQNIESKTIKCINEFTDGLTCLLCLGFRKMSKDKENISKFCQNVSMELLTLSLVHIESAVKTATSWLANTDTSLKDSFHCSQF